MKISFFKMKMILLFLLMLQFVRIESSGKIAIQLISYFNTNDFDFDGQCCNGDLVVLNNNSSPVCSKRCNTLLTLCLDSISSSFDFSTCPFGSRNLSAINEQSDIYFSTPIAGDVENPVLMPFSNNYQVIILQEKLSFFFKFELLEFLKNFLILLNYYT